MKQKKYFTHFFYRKKQKHIYEEFYISIQIKMLHSNFMDAFLINEGGKHNFF